MFSLKIWQLIFLAFVSGTHQTLYTREDPIVQLDNLSLFRMIFGSRTAWFVEFYQSTCGHCRSFAPTYVSLALDVKAWESVVRIAAIDCAAQENVPTCKHFGIEAVPTIRFFHAFSKNITNGKANLGLECKLDEKEFTSVKKGVKSLSVSIIDFIRKQPNHPAHWPRFVPLSVGEVKDLTSRQQRKSSAIVFEDQSSQIGHQVILDTQPCHNLKVYRVLNSQSTIVKQFGASSFPSLLLFGHGRPHFVTVRNNTHESYRDYLLHLCGHASPSMRSVVTKPRFFRKPPRTHFTPAVHMEDLVSTVAYIIHREVALHAILHGAALQALTRFLEVLHHCMPAPSHVEQHLAYIVRQLMIYSKSGIRGQTWQRISSRKTASSWISADIRWKGCHGSLPHHRGYSCGLWTLFHTMASHCLLATEGGAIASAMRRYSGRIHHENEAAALFAIGRRRPSSMTSKGTLLAIRNYVKYFFACADCRQHFIAISTNLSSQVRDSRDAVLWLWRVHNNVNRRLAHDPSSDPLFPKIQFPHPSLCDDCREKTSGTENPKSIAWDNDRVFSFLLQFYGPSGIRWGSEVEDHHHGLISELHHDQPHPLASAVFFMAFSFVGLLALYYWFKATHMHPTPFYKWCAPAKKTRHMV